MLFGTAGLGTVLNGLGLSTNVIRSTDSGTNASCHHTRKFTPEAGHKEIFCCFLYYEQGHFAVSNPVVLDWFYMTLLQHMRY
jgi:hypothetical protein